jgi:2-amino-4-hydroxy-6-hydroxymethyldihydropteridine diphosphokinase
LTQTLVYLSLGSNLGDRAANLRTAITALPSINFQVRRVSSFYETEPVDYLDQPWFLNCVVEGETDSQPIELLRALRAIESELGSKKAFAKGPRLLDIDILLFGDQSVDTPELQVPHPRMLERNFVLTPLAEIAPQLQHPSWTATARQLLANTADPSVVRPLK